MSQSSLPLFLPALKRPRRHRRRRPERPDHRLDRYIAATDTPMTCAIFATYGRSAGRSRRAPRGGPRTSYCAEAQAVFCRRRHQPRRPTLQLAIAVPKAKRAGLSASTLSLVIDSVLRTGGSDDELTTASRQGDKPRACQDQTRQSCADDGAGDRYCSKGCVDRAR